MTDVGWVELFATSTFDNTRISPTIQTVKMPPKKVYVERGLGSGKRIQKGYFRSTYDTLTSPENSAMVKSIAAFGVG